MGHGREVDRRAAHGLCRSRGAIAHVVAALLLAGCARCGTTPRSPSGPPPEYEDPPPPSWLKDAGRAPSPEPLVLPPEPPPPPFAPFGEPPPPPQATEPPAEPPAAPPPSAPPATPDAG